MQTNFKIDQAATFAGVVFLSCAPKTAFNSTAQETTKDGTRKWTVEVLAATRSAFGGTSNEVIKVGVASHQDPGADVPAFSPVHLIDFEVGVMERTKKIDGVEKVIGAQVWFRASEIRPLSATSGRAA